MKRAQRICQNHFSPEPETFGYIPLLVLTRSYGSQNDVDTIYPNMSNPIIAKKSIAKYWGLL